MLVVDASALYELVARTARAETIARRLLQDRDLAAPAVIDVEVLGIVRRHFFAGQLDATAAQLAMMDLRDWPAERFDHRGLLNRAWELRANVRGWDAMYVALAEAMRATLITTDARLARVRGLECAIEVVTA